MLEEEQEEVVDLDDSEQRQQAAKRVWKYERVLGRQQGGGQQQ